VDGATIGSWAFDAATPGNAAQTGNIRSVTLDTAFRVGPDSVLTIAATTSADEFARIDYIELIPAPAPALNAAPAITSTASVTVAENLAAVMAVTATDADGDGLTYSIAGGADGALFAIDAATAHSPSRPPRTSRLRPTRARTTSTWWRSPCPTARPT
jgi:hypothetical protein